MSDTQAKALAFEHPDLDVLLDAERLLPKNPTKAQIDAFNKQLREDLD